jgi:hypothetical protein
MTLTDRLPPHDIEAEEAVIASVMVDPEAWASVCGIVTQWDFFREKNGWIFQACADLTADGISLNQVTVGHLLARKDQLEEVGGNAYLSKLTTDLATPVGCEHYAQIVRKDALYRSAIIRAQNVISAAYRAKGNLTELLDDWQRAGEELRGEATGLLGLPEECRAESLADILNAEDDALDAVITDGGEGAVLTSDGKGFIVGPPGLGKTNLALRMSRGLCEGSYALGYRVPAPQTVLMISLEGSKRTLKRRLQKVWEDAEPDAIARFHLARITLNLAEPTDLNRLNLLLEQVRPTVVIIDPLRNAHPWDENASDQAARLTGTLDAIIARQHIALILIHHDRKLPPFVRQSTGLEGVRGSTALTGWVQFVLGMSHESGNLKDRFVLVWSKTRDAEELLEPLVVDFDREHLDFIIDENAAAGGKVSDDAILTAIFNNGGVMRGLEVVEGFVHGAGASERTVRTTLRALVRTGKLVEFITAEDMLKRKAKSYRLPDNEGSEAQ